MNFYHFLKFTVGKPEVITNWLFSKQRTHELTIVFLWLLRGCCEPGLPCGNFLFLIPKAPLFFFHGNREVPGDEVCESSSHSHSFHRALHPAIFEMSLWKDLLRYLLWNDWIVARRVQEESFPNISKSWSIGDPEGSWSLNIFLRFICTL